MNSAPGTIPIRTRRLLLRRFTTEDAPAVHTGWMSDAAMTRWLLWNAHETGEETRAIVRGWCFAYEEEPDYYNWAITLADTGEVCGSIGLTLCADGPQLGYLVGRRWQNKGYATEAVTAVCRFLEEKAGIYRIAALCAAENTASLRVLEKAGFVYERDMTRKSYDKTRQLACRLMLRQTQP